MITDLHKCAIILFMKAKASHPEKHITGGHAGAVLGTDHAAENITGFFTKYGDGGADLLPLFRLDKRQGKQL